MARISSSDYLEYAIGYLLWRGGAFHHFLKDSLRSAAQFSTAECILIGLSGTLSALNRRQLLNITVKITDSLSMGAHRIPLLRREHALPQRRSGKIIDALCRFCRINLTG